jgi:hypothetical protein
MMTTDIAIDIGIAIAIAGIVLTVAIYIWWLTTTPRR